MPPTIKRGNKKNSASFIVRYQKKIFSYILLDYRGQLKKGDHINIKSLGLVEVVRATKGCIQVKLLKAQVQWLEDNRQRLYENIGVHNNRR